MNDDDGRWRHGRRAWLSRAGWIAGLGVVAGADCAAGRMVAEGPFADVQRKLTPLCEVLGPPGPNDWLAEHKEDGQSFDVYFRSKPIRRNEKLTTIYLSVLGETSEPEKRIFELTRDYMERFFDTPVKFGRPIASDTIPDRAKRAHPTWKVHQILTKHVLDEVLTPTRPGDALAYLALTTSDLWPGAGWNFVFGQASLQARVGVWSIHRFGDPAASEASFRTCLRRTLGTASHETMHILSMPHCIEYVCCLNGCNHLVEADTKPLHACAVCERKLSWNLGKGPVERYRKLEAFCRGQGFSDDADWLAKAIGVLKTD